MKDGVTQRYLSFCISNFPCFIFAFAEKLLPLRRFNTKTPVMNKRFTLFLLYVLSACVPSVLADPIIEDGVYSISCEQGDRDGFVGLGAYHDIDPFICYIKDNQELTEDAYWVVTNTRSGYTFRNEASGQYLIYTTGRVDAYYKGMTLADEAPEDKSHFWDIIDAGNGYVYVQSTISPSYYWNLRYSQGLLGTYAGSSRSNNERFYFTKKADPGPGPGPGPGPEEPEVANAFPKALHVYLKDGRVEAYPLKYITNYSQTNIRLIIETNIGKTFTYRQADIDSISENTPTNFPTFVSFKFNNKFND